MGQPMLLNIEVSSTKDYSDLHVLLQTTSGVTVDGPQSWENYLITSVNEPGIVYWDFAIKAGQTLAFNRVLRFPSQEGYYQIIVEVVNKDRSIDAIENFHVLLEHYGAQVIGNGTPIPPYTPNVTSASYGLGTPVPTDVPNIQTVNATLATQTTPTPFSPLLATSTPLTSPYPPPPSSSPTPTPQSSPYP